MMKKKHVALLFSTCALAFSACTPKPTNPAFAAVDYAIFKDLMATSLRWNVSEADINTLENDDLKAVALGLLNKNYPLNYRVAKFKAVLSPEALGKQLHIGNGYSNYENMTGILLKKGKQTLLVNNIAPNTELTIVVPNWDRRPPEGIKPTKDPNGWGIKSHTYTIKNGFNELDIKQDGLAYVDYYSETPEKETEIEIHFLNDPVNGYFDVSTQTNADWDNLLDKAVYPVIDAKGKHVQIAYPVEACKKYAAGKGVELLSNYDSLVYRQHRFIGLEKYNKVPSNKILARVNYNYYMFRDGDGVAYMGGTPGNAMAMVVDPARVIKGDPCWGFNHEVGHVHQLRPYLNWGGLGEVSNNIVTLYVTTSYGNQSRLSQQKSYAKARKSIIEGGISLLQDKDVFNRLVPFWQLQLYFAQTGNTDFYPDLHEALRSGESVGTDWGDRGKDAVAELQLNFVKQVCKVGKTDLTTFFDQWGFFKTGEFELNDYGKYQYKMTEAMVSACKEEIKAMNLPQSTMDLTLLED